MTTVGEHPNLISLIGACTERGTRTENYLIFPHISNHYVTACVTEFLNYLISSL